VRVVVLWKRLVLRWQLTQFPSYAASRLSVDIDLCRMATHQWKGPHTNAQCPARDRPAEDLEILKLARCVRLLAVCRIAVRLWLY
jgi:hypothetical protein